MLVLIISSDNKSSKYFCIARFKGLAPNLVSKPFSAINSFASLDIFTLNPNF